MEDPARRTQADSDLVFAAHNFHTAPCGAPPGVRNTDNPELYYGYFENCFGEQFVFMFDRETKTGTISGGDLDWGNPKSFTLELLDTALQVTQELAAQILALGQTKASDLPIVDAALALGRLSGLTGKEEIIWLRACLAACTAFDRSAPTKNGP
jgi:hypothetical protein